MKLLVKIFVGVGAVGAVIFSVAKPEFTDIYTKFNSGFEFTAIDPPVGPTLVMETQAEGLKCTLRLKVVDSEGKPVVSENLGFGFDPRKPSTLSVKEVEDDWILVDRQSETESYFPWQSGSRLYAIYSSEQPTSIRVVDWELIPEKGPRDSKTNQRNRTLVKWILRVVLFGMIISAALAVIIKDDKDAAEIERVTRDHINCIIDEVEWQGAIETAVSRKLLKAWVKLKLVDSPDHPLKVVKWQSKVSDDEIHHLWQLTRSDFVGRLREFDPMGIFRKLLK